MNTDIQQVSVSDVPGVTTSDAFIVFRRGDTESHAVCAFCRQKVSEILMTPCCESARRCQERQANARVEPLPAQEKGQTS